MLTGRFGDTSGRPYIEGRLSLTRLGIAADISFLIDTGADRSVLMPLDGRRMNLDYDLLVAEQPCAGVGGITKACLETAVIAFSNNIAVYVYEVELLIIKPKRGIMATSSIVGRDVLHRLAITYDFSNSQLEMHNRSADHIAVIEPHDG